MGILLGITAKAEEENSGYKMDMLLRSRSGLIGQKSPWAYTCSDVSLYHAPSSLLCRYPLSLTGVGTYTERIGVADDGNQLST